MVHREIIDTLQYEVNKVQYNDWSDQLNFGTGRREIDDQNNYFHERRGGGGDVGGPLTSVTRTYSLQSPKLDLNFPERPNQRFIGRVYPVYGNFDWRVFPTVPITSALSLWGKGGTGIARCLPTNPVSNLAQGLGEIYRDGIPEIVGKSLLKERVKEQVKARSQSLSVKAKARVARESGSEYLNVEFGWKPLVSDVLKFANAVKSSDKMVKQFERDSGKNLRRRYSFPDSDTITSTVSAGYIPSVSPGTNLVPGYSGVLYTTDHTQVKTWFSGCFTYHVDMGDNIHAKSERFLQEANKLYGTRLTPDVLWNLAPWSWAADWFWNYGDVIQNATAFSNDGLVMRYGYIMEQTTRSIAYTLVGLTDIYGHHLPPASQTFTTTVKRREAASPYGFGQVFEGFSTRQQAIIAALGISKGGVPYSK